MRIIDYRKETDILVLSRDKEEDQQIFCTAEDIFKSVQTPEAQNHLEAVELATKGYNASTNLQQLSKMAESEYSIEASASNIVDLSNMLLFFANDTSGRFLSGPTFKRSFARRTGQNLLDTYLHISGQAAKKPDAPSGGPSMQRLAV